MDALGELGGNPETVKSLGSLMKKKGIWIALRVLLNKLNINIAFSDIEVLPDLVFSLM